MAARKTAPHPVVRETIDKRPTGTITSVVAAAVVVATALGLEISAELSAAIVGLAGALSSYYHPR